MTNTQIIYEALKATGLSDEQLLNLMQTYNALPYHTFQEWKRRGFQVKRGERACLKVYLWKYTNKAPQAERQEAEANGEEIGEDPHYYKKLCHLFSITQCEQIQAVA